MSSNETEFPVDCHELVRVYERAGKGSSIRGLDGVSFRVGCGEVHGLLGPNGAGKTTLVKIFSTVLLPTSGYARICGFDVVRETRRVREVIGTVFGGEKGLYQHLTGRENLEHWASLYGIGPVEGRMRAARLLERVGLSERGDDRVEVYSRGMKQRLHLARGLVNDARVLFLDEPTIGMDPVAAREFRSLVAELRSEGRTILLTTHDMAEAESVCDRVALISAGKIVAVETPKSLAQLVARFERVEFFGGDSDVLAEVASIEGVEKVMSMAGGGYRVLLDERGNVRTVINYLLERGITSLRTSRPNLEEVYFHVLGTGKPEEESIVRSAP
jgi:ABC-2 type transport system ATP-binding protein